MSLDNTLPASSIFIQMVAVNINNKKCIPNTSIFAIIRVSNLSEYGLSISVSQESYRVRVHQLVKSRRPDQEPGAGGQVHWRLAVHVSCRRVCSQVVHGVKRTGAACVLDA